MLVAELREELGHFQTCFRQREALMILSGPNTLEMMMGTSIVP